MKKFLFLLVSFSLSISGLFACKKCYKEIHTFRKLVDKEVAKLEKKKKLDSKAVMGYVQYIGMAQGLEYAEHMIVYYHRNVEKKHKHRKKELTLEQALERSRKRMKPFPIKLPSKAP